MERNITISEQIDRDYRNYALYVIQSRGIPNFYDSLTPVQRLILLNSPSSLKKTVGVIGEVFSTGLYHHGDTSMAKAISKLARPFGCSDQILIGDGFFGSPVNPNPAAARYTQVKISNKYKDLIEKYKDLNVVNEEGGNDWINLDYPIGLATHIVGIAVGYKSNVLPRKHEDVFSYLTSKNKKPVKPHFKGFKGKITRINSLRSSWLIEGETEIDPDNKIFKIDSISPLQSYKQFFDRLNNLLEKSLLNYKIENFSTDQVKMTIKFRCIDQEFKSISEKISNETKQIVTENIVFVKDGNVLEYDCIEDYLDDFIPHKNLVLLKRLEKDLSYLDFDLQYLDAKLKFLIFMSDKKRDNKEVTEFLSQFQKEISRRLESISLTRLTKEEIIKTKEEINQCKSDIKDKNQQIKIQNELLNESLKLNKELIKNRIKNKSNLLLSDSTHNEEYYNGIRIFNPDELELENEEQIETDTENE